MKCGLLSVVLIVAGCNSRYPVSPAEGSGSGPPKADRTSEERAVHTNRLAAETSPYLLQHAHNPVDWYPWGDEAFAKARAEDRPVLLSIGYSACHWCHVMERESFENEGIAAILNRGFVAIKVDREERPDVDEVYMTAVQMMTGSGGWPLNVFLTPDKKPFFGGTYFPPEDRWGRTGFSNVLVQIETAWREQRESIDTQSESLSARVARVMTTTPESGEIPSFDLVDTKVAGEIVAEHDPVFGGFSREPKFPAVSRLRHLLRMGRSGDKPSRDAREAALHTLRMMARGGIYDQVGGGFHRYSVDAQWLVPHFEKMLYDNARLAVVYIEAFQLTEDPFYARIARQTLDYLLRDMVSPDGTLFSAEDADSGGHEGIFYTWTPDELKSVLGESDAAWLGDVYGVTSQGNFEGRSILFLPQEPDETAQGLGLTPEDMNRRIDPLRVKLLELRAGRERPLRDEKVITSWNGMALSALAVGGLVLEEPRYLNAAAAIATFFRKELEEGTLMRIHAEDRAYVPAYLDDYADLAAGLIDLYEVTGDTAWLKSAILAARTIEDEFYDTSAHAFASSGSRHETLLSKSYPLMDGVVPPGGAVAVDVLLRLHALTGREEWLNVAEDALRGAGLSDERRVGHMTTMLRAAAVLPGRATELLMVLPDGDDGQALRDVLRSGYYPTVVSAFVKEGASTELLAPALVADRTAVEGKPTAYVCRAFSCGLPVTTPVALRAQLKGDDAQ